MFTQTVINMKKSETNNGKTFGFWLNGKEVKESRIEEEIAKNGGSASAFVKKKLDENKELRTALKDLYEFMGSDSMDFTNPLSPTDLKFLEYVTGLINRE